jgi:hypothetical protein
MVSLQQHLIRRLDPIRRGHHLVSNLPLDEVGFLVYAGVFQLELLVVAQEGLERRKDLVGDLILVRLKLVAMISLPIQLEFIASLNLTRGELMTKLEHRVAPSALKLEHALGNSYLHFDVGIDSSATVDRAARVRSLFVRVSPVLVAPLQVVVVERPPAVVALAQTAARRVVVPRCQYQRRTKESGSLSHSCQIVGPTRLSSRSSPQSGCSSTRD